MSWTRGPTYPLDPSTCLEDKLSSGHCTSLDLLEYWIETPAFRAILMSGFQSRNRAEERRGLTNSKLRLPSCRDSFFGELISGSRESLFSLAKSCLPSASGPSITLDSRKSSLLKFCRPSESFNTSLIFSLREAIFSFRV